MASWNRLFIDGHEARINKIEKERQSFKDCDEEGNIIKAEYKREKRVFKDSEGKEIWGVYKLVNGKARRKLQRTTMIKLEEKNFVDMKEVGDLIIECYYLVDCEPIRQKLVKIKKAIKTAYTCGNGFKVYEAYIVPYKKWMVMILGFGRLDTQIQELLGSYIPQHERENLDYERIKRVTEEELLGEVYEKEIEVKV